MAIRGGPCYGKDHCRMLFLRIFRVYLTSHTINILQDKGEQGHLIEIKCFLLYFMFNFDSLLLVLKDIILVFFRLSVRF